MNEPHHSQLGLFPDDPCVTFQPSGRKVRVLPGETLLQAARLAGLPMAQSCGAAAVCSWCRIRIVAGAESLSTILCAEERVRTRASYTVDERAACQAEVLGDVVVTTTYW